uniref:Prenylcysteine oxidase 1 n=1 Tax=Geospiza parvula TaxID=87175 RepID=A0A8C3MJV4_GEOPR
MKHFVQELGEHGHPTVVFSRRLQWGEEFVFEESSWSFINLLKLLWHYGLNPLRMSMWVEDILDKFMRWVGVLRGEEEGKDLKDTSFHGQGHLPLSLVAPSCVQPGFSQKFINQVVCPAMRVNYGAFLAGAVSLAGVQSGLWSVKGGNKLVCSGLIYSSKAEVIPGTVVSIEPKTRHQRGDPVKLYEVTYNTSSGLTGDTYDIVVIAAPFGRKMANITFRNFDPPIPEFPNPFQQIFTTLVHGRLNTSFFGYQDPQAFHLGAIFTTDNPKLFINSLTLESPVGDTGTGGELPLPSAVWKVFSNEELSKEQLSLLFSSYDSVKVKPWLAYPQYSAPEKFPPIVLHEQLYYLNGLERAASAMEMSAIAARNAALLAFHRWHGHSASVDQEDLHERLKTEL